MVADKINKRQEISEAIYFLDTF